MRRKIFFITVASLLFSSYLYSENPTGPNVLNNESPSSITFQRHLVDSLNNLSSVVLDSLKNLSEQYAERALMISRRINYLEGEGLSSYNLGVYYMYSNQYPIGLEYLFNALNLSNHQKNYGLSARVLNKICLIFIKLKSLDKAKIYYTKSINTAIAIKDTNSLIESLIRESEILNAEGDLKKSLTVLYRALWYSNKINDIRSLAGVNKFIGNCFLQMKDYKNAEYYYKKTIELSIKNNFYIDLGTIYSSLAIIYQTNGEIRKSLAYNFLALKVRRATNQADLVASSLINIGKTYYRMNRIDSSIRYISIGLEIANTLKINLLQEIGNRYFYELYLNRNDYKSALSYYMKYIEAKDNLNLTHNKEETELIDANQIIQENERKSAFLITENELQRSRIKYSRIQIIFLIILAFFLTGIISYVYSQYIRNKRSKIMLQKLNAKLDQEIEERLIIEAQLIKSEALHHFLTDNSLDVISRIDNNFRYTYVSPSCVALYGYTQQELLNTADIFFRSDEVTARGLKSKFQDMIDRREPLKFTYQTRKKDGTPFWVESHLNPIFDENGGTFSELISVSRDISERVRYEESLIESGKQKDFLMREIHHRTKNNFAILISLLNIQKYQAGNTHLFDILSDLQARIRTMVLIHEQLHRSNSVDTVAFAPYLRNLSSTVASAFRKEGIHLHLDISDCQLNIETALPVALIVNELLTNSFKYAFNGKEHGNIIIRLLPGSGQDDRRTWWELVIEDDGIGLPESFSLPGSNSMGSLIIVTLADQIRAKLEVSGTAGASFRILFPEG